MSAEKNKDCFLLLEDGSIFPGRSFGANRQIDGEVGELEFFFFSFMQINTWSNTTIFFVFIFFIFLCKSTRAYSILFFSSI